MKVVINSCHGGFSLSPEATLRLWQLGAPIDATPIDEYFGTRDPNERFGRNEALREWREYLATEPGARSAGLFVTVFTPDETKVLNVREIPRDHPLLVQVVEEMGEAADGSCAALKIVEIPDDVAWEIDEYDGSEWVSEKHRRWS